MADLSCRNSSLTCDVYIRDALPTEHDTIARLLTRAFAQDPSMNWLGSVSRLVPVPSAKEMENTPLWRLPKELELLYYFRRAYVISAQLSGGRITVAVRRAQEPDGSEKIVSVAAWFPPGAKINNPLIILKSKQHRTVFGSWRRPGGWGMRGLKRTLLEATPAIDKSLNDGFNTRGLDYRKSWTLSNVATDPDEKGKGYCRLLVNYGLENLVGTSPTCLEATTAKSRDIYEHYGFEIIEKLTFGAGKVNEQGIPALDNNSEGYLSGISNWTMILPNTRKS